MLRDIFYERHLQVVFQLHGPSSNSERKLSDRLNNVTIRLLLLLNQAALLSQYAIWNICIITKDYITQI